MEILDDPSETLRWEVAEACPYATFYHTPVWHRLAEQSDASRTDRTLGVQFDSGPRAVLPVLEERGLTSKRVSTFAGCYGDLIADGPLEEHEVEDFYRHVLSRDRKSLKIISNPLSEHSVNRQLGEEEVDEDYTHILELEGDLESITAGYSRGHRSSLNKSKRMGVAARPASSLDDYKAYFGAYEDSLRRWDKDPSTGYAWPLFEAAHALSREYPSLITLWLAEVEGEVASGALIFYWNRHVSYWHGAAYEEYLDYRPNNLLHTEIIRDALEREFDYYDFNPSGGYEGVAQFKARFGAEKRPLTRRTFNQSILDRLFG